MFGNVKLAAAFMGLSLATSAVATHCDKIKQDDYFVSYDIWAENVVNIAGFCGGLWDNMKRFPECGVIYSAYCGGIEETHILQWSFGVSVLCNSGMVESSWWEATQNQFGSISCYAEGTG